MMSKSRLMMRLIMVMLLTVSKMQRKIANKVKFTVHGVCARLRIEAMWVRPWCEVQCFGVVECVKEYCMQHWLQGGEAVWASRPGLRPRHGWGGVEWAKVSLALTHLATASTYTIVLYTFIWACSWYIASMEIGVIWLHYLVPDFQIFPKNSFYN